MDKTVKKEIKKKQKESYLQQPSKPKEENLKKPILKTEKRRSSALSLNSVYKKNDAKKTVVNILEDHENLPKDPFTEAQFVILWNTYTEELIKKGEKIVASIMNADTPKILENKILLTFPNSMMKSELLKMRPKLLAYFREQLNNYSIDFDISVNEKNEKKFAYTPEEKYNKLLEKNKALAKLRNIFKLDL